MSRSEKNEAWKGGKCINYTLVVGMYIETQSFGGSFEK